MIQFFSEEEWKEFFPEGKFKFRYAISNFGRLLSFTDTFENGNLLRGGSIEGYKVIRFKNFFPGIAKNRCLFVHKLLAENFLVKDSEEQTFVLHLDYNKANNRLTNLKWATQKEMREHQQKNPLVIEGHKKTLEKKKGAGHKLTAATVTLIKKKLLDPNRKTRMKMLARQFGISEMQLYRIKSGENWAHVVVENVKKYPLPTSN